MMAAIFDNDVQWRSPNLNSHTIANGKFRFVRANTLAQPKRHTQAQIEAMRDSMHQEQVV